MTDQIYVHIIGYAIPAMPAEEVMRGPDFDVINIQGPTRFDIDIDMHLETPPAYTLSELMAHIGDVAAPQYDSSFGAPWNSNFGTDNDLDRPLTYDYSESTTGEHWGDAMHWHHEEGKEPL
jgi:hypothetical protein